MNCLISLHEVYWNQIISGQKKFEFRRKFNPKTTRVYVYLSRSCFEVVGYFEVIEIVKDSPKNLAKLGEVSSPGSYNLILDYFVNLDYGYAIRIGEVKIFSKPIPLSFLRKNFHFTPPQNYLILENFPELKTYLENYRIIQLI